MRFAAVLFSLLSLSAFADFYVGDTALTADRPLRLGQVVLASDGELFYVFAGSGMNRVRPDGSIVDAEPFGVREIVQPLSAAYGRGILVVTHRSVGALDARSSFATAMTVNGEVLWTNHVANDTASVVYDGRDFVIVFRRHEGIVAATLDDAGFHAHSSILAPLDEYTRASAPLAVRTNSGLVAAWRDSEALYTIAFDASGARGVPAVAGQGRISGFGSELNGSFALATNSDEALLVWVNHGTGDAARMWLSAREISSGGTPLGDVLEMDVTGRPFEPSVVWDGASYRVAWMAYTDGFIGTAVYAAAVSSGQATLPERITGEAISAWPVLAVAGQRVLLAWNAWEEGGVRGKIAGSSESFAGVPEQFVRTTPFDAIAPTAVWTGQHYAIAWLRQGGVNAPPTIVVRRFDRNGAPLDSEPRPIATVVNTNRIRSASTGSEIAIVWNDGGRVYVARVSSDGVPMDPEPLLVDTDVPDETADIAASGNRFLVVWAGDSAVHARRLSARGGFVDAQPLTVAERDASVSRVVFDGSSFTVAWVSPDGLEAAPVTTSGVVGAARLLSEEAYPRELAVATNGATTLFNSGRIYVLTRADLREPRVIEGHYAAWANAVWTGKSFLVSGTGMIAWVSPAGVVATRPSEPTIFDLPQNGLVSAGDGTAIEVYNAPTRSFRAALYGRFLAPRRRASAHSE
jgi:hypothetical protein